MSDNPAADPFHERVSHPWRTNLALMGASFEFQSNSRRLLRLVDVAYAGLPSQHVPPRAVPFRIRLTLSGRATGKCGAEPPPLRTLSGPADLLCGIMDAANFALLSPRQRSGLVAVSRNMLAHPYHLRYELIEFAVYTLASRGQDLLSMHAACVGTAGRGLLLLGDSGAGKSTLALHALLQGMDLIAEDAVFVRPDRLAATGVSNFLHVGRDSLQFLEPRMAARLARFPAIQRRSGVEKLEIDLRRLGRPLRAPPLRIEGVVFLSRRPASAARSLLPLRQGEMMTRLSAAQSYASLQPAWRSFRQRLRGVQGFELRRESHPAAAAATLQRLLR